MGQHWERARLNAEIPGDSAVNGGDGERRRRSRCEMGSGGCPLDMARKAGGRHRRPEADGARARCRTVRGPRTSARTARSGKSRMRAARAGLHKRHGLQGPIDDAFLDSFVFVSPTGTPLAPAVAKWVAGEEARAIKEWRREFRGEAQVRDDSEVSDAEIAASNLVLWGDPRSNRILARIADKLPVKWTASGHRRGQGSLLGRDARGDFDLSESAESEEVCGTEQRLYLSRGRLPEQRAANAEVAGLRGGGSDYAAGRAISGKDCVRRVLR